MANKVGNQGLLTSNDIYVEFSEQNVVLVDPNKVVDALGAIRERTVNPEELTIYANLTANLIPRSKLVVGDGAEAENFVQIFDGQINFLKPKDKSYLTADWTDTFTGKKVYDEDGNLLGSLNQKTYNKTKDPFTGKDTTTESIKNQLDSESFGIESISITLNPAYIPQVTINFVDVRGKTLFEQGENSPYSAFFQLPWPTFYLTLKGYYGKAVKYQLIMKSFNASFDPGTGNYAVVCSFVGKISTILADITVQNIINAPYMYPRTYESNPASDNETKNTLITTKGAQTLHEVYQNYKNKGLIDKDLPEITLYDLILRIQKMEATIEESIKKENLSGLDDIVTYEKALDVYRGRIFGSGGWKNRYMSKEDLDIYVNPKNEVTYYTWAKKYADDESLREEALNKLKKIIKDENRKLTNNHTFGSSGVAGYYKDAHKYGTLSIPVDISYTDFLWKPYGANEQKQWFAFDELDGSFDKKLAKIQNNFQEKRTKLEGEVTQVMNSIITGENGLGFSPSIRNIFAILIAGADTFLRLLNDTHVDAMAVSKDKKRIEVVNTMGTTNIENLEDEIVFPWPAYYVRKANDDGGQDFVLTYPGASSVIGETQGYKMEKWPEVSFVEEYLRATAVKDKNPTLQIGSSTINENWMPVSAADFTESQLYSDTDTISFYYEIWDRSILHTFLSGVQTRLMNNMVKAPLQGMAKLESINVTEKSDGAFDLQEQLKNQNLDGNSLLVYLRDLSPLNRYQILLNDNYSTEYIRDMINGKRMELIPIVEYQVDSHSNNKTVRDEEALIEIKTAITTPKGNLEETVFDTYPFADFDITSKGIVGGNVVNLYSYDETTDEINYGPWIKNNLANGRNIPSIQELYKIEDNLFLGEDSKVPTTDNLMWYTDLSTLGDSQYQASERLNLRTLNLSDTVASWSDFYKDIQDMSNYGDKTSEFFVTEGALSYSSGHTTGKVGEYQITSMLNTPYFTNAFRDGVVNQVNNTPNPYSKAAYLFLNSLPLNTLREKGPSSVVVGEQTSTQIYGDYVFATLNQIGAVHQMPYSWILRYGSIWHRYKTWVKTGVDILDSTLR